MRAREGEARIISLSDLTDILNIYQDRCSPIRMLIPEDPIPVIEKLADTVRDYARVHKRHDVWLNLNLTEAYIRIIFDENVRQDSLAYRILFLNNRRIGRINRFLRQLKDYELNTYDTVRTMAACADAERLACAGEILRNNDVCVSDSLLNKLVIHHDCAVSLARCFVMLSVMDDSASLLFAVIEHFELVRRNMIDHEKSVYQYGPDTAHGFTAALIRLHDNHLKLSKDELIFMMRNHDCAIGIAATFVLLSRHAQQAEMRRSFMQNFHLVRAHFVIMENAICANSDILRQVIDPGQQRGFLVSLWRLCSHPYIHDELYAWENIEALMRHHECADEISQALMQVRVSAGVEEGDISAILAAVRQHPYKSKQIADLFCRLTPGERVLPFSLVNFSRLTGKHLQRLTGIFETFSGMRSETELCVASNLVLLINSSRYLGSLLLLFRNLATLTAGEQGLNQQQFLDVLSVAKYAHNFHMLGSLIKGGKFHDQYLLRLLDYPRYANELCKAMHYLADYMPVINRCHNRPLLCLKGEDQFPDPFIEKMLDTIFVYPGIAAQLAKAACDRIHTDKSYPDVSQIDIITDLVRVARNGLPPQLRINDVPLESARRLAPASDPRFLRRTPPMPREYFEKVMATTKVKIVDQGDKKKKSSSRKTRLAVIH